RLWATLRFNMSGTLTMGYNTFVDTSAVEGESTGHFLALAGAVEADSEHPVARAITRSAEQVEGVSAASDFRSLPGRGVRASVGGRTVHVGGPALLESLGIGEPTDLAEHTDTWRGRGATVLHVVDDGVVVGAVSLADEVRPESAAVVRQLRDQGVRVAMVTGDSRDV